jgi:hypothetical protein
MGRLTGGILTALVVIWLLVALGLVFVVGLEWLALDDDNCPVPDVPAVYGEAEWQVWPPGEVCTLGSGELSGPPAYRGWLIVAELVLGLALVVLWRLRRDAPDPDWTA